MNSSQDPAQVGQATDRGLPAAAAPANPAEPSSSAPAHSQVLRAILSQRQLRDSIRLTSPPSLRITLVAAAQAALTVLLAMVVVRLSPWPHLVGFASLGALAALFGRFAPLSQRKRIVLLSAGLLTVAVLVQSLVSLAGAAPWLMLLALALITGAATWAVSHWVLGAPGAVIVSFAAGAALAPVSSWAVVADRGWATAAGGAIACLVCWATDWSRSAALPQLQLPAPVAMPMRDALMTAGRITLCAALAALIASAAGWQHPVWAAIGATAVMQGAHLHITMNRALQRMAGTVVGAMLAGLVLSQQPGFWWVVALIVLLQFVTELVIGYNYALGQITVTPMALLMVYLVAPTTGGSMPVERILDTVLGAALGVVFAVVFSTLDDRRYLHQMHQK